ncbi:MAG TPA: hypothetical protein EYP21_06775 [Syntrophaceae bacterium]|nr:hypothetical protein [Syntrophaceae bacterium]
MEFKKAIGSAVAVIAIIALVIWAGCAERMAAPTPTPAPAPTPAPGPEAPPLYTQEVEPLKPHECGRCHITFYNIIKTEGTKHQIDCTRCHTQFHVYRPGKVQYEDILPKCETCHGQIHGAALAGCSNCHIEAHAPLKIPASPKLEEGCSVCHLEVDKDIKTHISAHTDLDCSSCHHTKHGYIPECMECHEPHTEGMTQADCLSCHPPHTPLKIVCPDETTQETCAACHKKAYDVLKESATKHTELLCTKCHPGQHRTILKCEACHGKPHGVAMLKKFKTCGECHGVAHNLIQTGS